MSRPQSKRTTVAATHGGKRTGAGAKPHATKLHRTNVFLDAETRAEAIRVGGNVSAGLRELARREIERRSVQKVSG